jgi:hypothetical protein
LLAFWGSVGQVKWLTCAEVVPGAGLVTCAVCPALDPTATVTPFPAMPLVPLQANVYVVVAKGETTCDPLTLLAPVHPPKAVQLVAFVDDQLSVVDCAGAIDAGVAVKLRVGADASVAVKLKVGAGASVTVTDFSTPPPVPLHVSV